MVVCGASPVAAALVRLAADMGYRVVSATRGGEPAPAGAAERHDSFALEALTLSEQDAVVVATQGRGDRDALAAALASPAGYVGMVGSRRKARTLLERLDPPPQQARLQALHAPAGLDIGAIEPEEIALAILGEVVRVRRHAVKSGRGEETHARAGEGVG